MRSWLQASLFEEISSDSPLVVGDRAFHLKLRRRLIMCILCVVQKWSRRAIGMLPWLVIPFIVLWALSQLFPPDLRFEITSPRLACVVVLLGTIFWYEILLPHLSVYRARRCARIREQQLNFALELQKLRKTATRRCRNCFTPYREQKPGGGKFMCSYCGHVSRRPILDIPGPPGRSGIFSNLMRKSGWFFNHDCPAWDGHTNHHWANNTQERSSEEETCSRAAIFIWKLIFSVFSLLMMFLRKFMKLGTPVEEGSLDEENKGSSKEGENISQESKGEKARRKAEEKRQARLEKEMLEEEERKQREEVARLIEDRRKLRDTQLEADKGRLQDSASDGSREGRKEEIDKRRRERKKDRDRNSSKSNSDVEDHDIRGKKEVEKKRELDRKNDYERPELLSKSVVKTKSDQARGTSLFSSRSSNGWNFFGKKSHAASIPATKSSKPVILQRRDNSSAGLLSFKPLPNGDFTQSSGNATPPVAPPINQINAPKKAWHQLFARPASRSQLHAEDFTRGLDQNEKPEIEKLDSVDQTLASHSLRNPIPPHPVVVELGRKSGAEETELFQDPCFVPDPVSFIGPISESLEELLSDSGSEFRDDILPEPSRIQKKPYDPSEIKKPSPIESPMSKLNYSASCSPKSRDQEMLTKNQFNDVTEHGTWQMWSSGLDLVGGPASWLSALKPGRMSNEVITHTPEKNILGKTMNDGSLLPHPWDPSTRLHSFPQIKVPLEPLQEHYYSGDWSLPVETGPLARPKQQDGGKEQSGVYGKWC